ncbi:uncharacterized protein LOC127471716 [Manacus candei]|uniref:uncharacterized protein LOC127471716 n=1 Tax=Manacus candei TaxID=415023 RepID=UPI0022272A12|nr:uncharacterized protein LOC127471716 [Manacus candei]
MLCCVCYQQSVWGGWGVGCFVLPCVPRAGRVYQSKLLYVAKFSKTLECEFASVYHEVSMETGCLMLPYLERLGAHVLSPFVAVLGNWQSFFCGFGRSGLCRLRCGGCAVLLRRRGRSAGGSCGVGQLPARGQARQTLARRWQAVGFRRWWLVSRCRLQPAGLGQRRRRRVGAGPARRLWRAPRGTGPAGGPSAGPAAQSGEKRRKAAKSGEKRRKAAKSGEKRRKAAKSGEKRRKAAKSSFGVSAVSERFFLNLKSLHCRHRQAGVGRRWPASSGAQDGAGGSDRVAAHFCFFHVAFGHSVVSAGAAGERGRC